MGVEDENITIIARDRAIRAGKINEIDNRIRQLKEQLGERLPELENAKKPLVSERSSLSRLQNKARLDIAEIMRQKKSRLSRCLA